MWMMPWDYTSAPAMVYNITPIVLVLRLVVLALVLVVDGRRRLTMRRRGEV
jgi:hypothetical protein